MARIHSVVVAVLAAALATALSGMPLPVPVPVAVAAPVAAPVTAPLFVEGAPPSSVLAPMPLARSTSTILAVSSVSAGDFTAIRLVATVTSSGCTAAGRVSFWDGPVLIAETAVRGGRAVVGTNLVGVGSHSLTAVLPSAGRCPGSSSAPVLLDPAGAAPAAGTVLVSLPTGALSITSPYTVAAPLSLGAAVVDPATSTYRAAAPLRNVVITDTRAGNLGFVASVVASPFRQGGGGASIPGSYAGMTQVRASQLPGNAMSATTLTLVDTAAAAPGIGRQRVFASYPSGQPIGSVRIDGLFSLERVPTAVSAGAYASTVTFTAI